MTIDEAARAAVIDLTPYMPIRGDQHQEAVVGIIARHMTALVAERDAIIAELKKLLTTTENMNRAVKAEAEFRARDAEIEQLKLAIRTHRDQHAEDRCWIDDQQLYAVLGDGNLGDNRVGDKAAMMINCARFIERRCETGGWKSYAELEAEIVRLTNSLDYQTQCRNTLDQHVAEACEILGMNRKEDMCDSWGLRERCVELRRQIATADELEAFQKTALDLNVGLTRITADTHKALDAAGVCEGGCLATRVGLLVQRATLAEAAVISEEATELREQIEVTEDNSDERLDLSWEVERLKQHLAAEEKCNLHLGAMNAQDERERAAGVLCGIPYEEHGCDWPDAVAERLVFVRQQLAAAEQRVAAMRQQMLDNCVGVTKAGNEYCIFCDYSELGRVAHRPTCLLAAPAPASPPRGDDTLSRPGAALEVTSVPIPPEVQEAMGEAIRAARGTPLRPKIVCLCGSGRFREAFEQAEFDETLAGKIVLTIGCNTKDIARTSDLEHHKPMLDELHKRKIDLANEVLVLNVGGYIGQSTRSEIEYAETHGRPVRYSEPLR